MISNERPSPYGGRSYGGHSGQGNSGYSGHGGSGYGGGHSGHKPAVAEDTLKSDKVQIERKTFVFTLKENPRGRFLRITEDVNGRRDTIIIPATGLEEFRKIFDDMVKTSGDTPPKTPME